MVLTQRPFGHTLDVVPTTFPLYNQFQFNPPSLRLRRCRKNLPSCDLHVYNTGMNTPDLSGLPVTEKLRIVTQLWNDIASSPEPITVPSEVIREASRRSAELDADSSIAIDDDELWRRVDG